MTYTNCQGYNPHQSQSCCGHDNGQTPAYTHTGFEAGAL